MRDRKAIFDFYKSARNKVAIECSTMKYEGSDFIGSGRLWESDTVSEHLPSIIHVTRLTKEQLYS